MEKRHGGHGESSSGDGMSMGMSAIFFSSTNTALYSNQWTPTTAGMYAGTCIFLMVLAFSYRGLFALKSWLEALWLAKALKRRFVVVEGKTPLSERLSQDSEATRGVLTVNGVDDSVVVVRNATSGIQPWRFSVDLPRALLMMVIVGVGYLLMLAVMTMNVGYFFSVLGGAFIGELAFGRFYNSEHH